MGRLRLRLLQAKHVDHLAERVTRTNWQQAFHALKAETLMGIVAWIARRMAATFARHCDNFPRILFTFHRSGVRETTRSLPVHKRIERNALNAKCLLAGFLSQRTGRGTSAVNAVPSSLGAFDSAVCDYQNTERKQSSRPSSTYDSPCVPDSRHSNPVVFTLPSARVVAAASLCILALTTACGPQVIPPVVKDAPPRTAPIHLGLVDGFHSPLPPDIASHYCGYGTDLTIRTPQLSADGLGAFVASLSCPQTHALVLIEGPDLALAETFAQIAEPLPGIRAIENMNEGELPPHNFGPEAWAKVQQSMAQGERDAGWTGDIITGGVYALTDETKRAILLVLPTCRHLDCMIGVHLYDPSADDIAWLDGLNIDIALTETGSPTGCGMSKWQAQADYLTGIYARVSQIRRLRYFVVYQRPSGPTCSNLDTFGIQSFDLTWKPADRFFFPRTP
jgi:hypothetical protein